MAVDRARAKGWDAELFAGPAHLRETLQCLSGWFCLEDRRYRRNEATDRGFMFATNDYALYEAVKPIFSYWSTIEYRDDFHCRYEPSKNMTIGVDINSGGDTDSSKQ